MADKTLLKWFQRKCQQLKIQTGPLRPSLLITMSHNPILSHYSREGWMYSYV